MFRRAKGYWKYDGKIHPGRYYVVMFDSIFEPYLLAIACRNPDKAHKFMLQNNLLQKAMAISGKEAIKQGIGVKKKTLSPKYSVKILYLNDLVQYPPSMQGIYNEKRVLVLKKRFNSITQLNQFNFKANGQHYYHYTSRVRFIVWLRRVKALARKHPGLKPFDPQEIRDTFYIGKTIPKRNWICLNWHMRLAKLHLVQEYMYGKTVSTPRLRPFNVRDLSDQPFVDIPRLSD